MVAVLEVFSLLRLGRIREIERSGAQATLRVDPVGGAPPVTVALDGVEELELVPPEGDVAPIADAAELSALQLEILYLVVDPGHVTMWVSARQRGAAVRGGRLRITARGARLFDSQGAPMDRKVLIEQSAAQVRERLTGSMKDYRKFLDALLREEVKPLLAAVGFTADKRTFLRVRPGLVDIIAIDVARFSSAVAMDFNLRIGVLAGDVPAAGKLTEDAARAATQPGYRHVFEPAYRVARGVDLRGVADRLLADLTGVALPRLDRLRTVDDLIAFLDAEDERTGRAEHAYVVGNILGRLGRLDEARAHFERALGVVDSIRRAAARWGITLQRTD